MRAPAPADYSGSTIFANQRPRTLSHLRFPAGASRGRRYPEPEHPYRNPYQRDRDRIVHARAFRRLKHKTQVFTTPLSDHFRDRLTHTIEVSQIARTAAGALGLNEDLVEALSLSHDLGHPPFGHAGEEVLDQRMRLHGERFDHNLHSLRIVEYFEERYAAFPGVNLTFEVREGIVKHSRDYSAEDYPFLEEYLLGQRPLIEQQLIDPADEAAYHCADLDDGVDAGLLDVQTAVNEVGLFGRVHSEARREFPQAPPRRIFLEALRRLLDGLVSGLIEGTRDAAAEAGAGTWEDVRRCRRRLARFTPEAEQARQELRGMLQSRVYRAALHRRSASADKVGELFDFFMERPGELPPQYQEAAQELPLHRVVCDYIAGMTDKFLLRLHSELGAGAAG